MSFEKDLTEIMKAFEVNEGEFSGSIWGNSPPMKSTAPTGPSATIDRPLSLSLTREEAEVVIDALQMAENGLPIIAKLKQAMV